MSRQDDFEATYAELNGIPVERVKFDRMGNGSYLTPKVATAWRWYQLGQQAVLVPLPPVYNCDDESYRGRCVQFIHAAGFGVIKP